MEQVIFHVDVNSAYLSWEAVHRMNRWGAKLDLRTVPSAIAGDPSLRRGIILAKSIPAGRMGIKTGEAIWEAKQKCPELVLAPPDYRLYRKASEAFFRLLKQYSPIIEPYSIDEYFVDMTGTAGLWGETVMAAHRLRKQIKRELGFTVNVGVSVNKLLAKMASDFRKPDQVHTLFPEEIETKMWPLPVSSLFFVGRPTAKKLFSLGIRTIGELAAFDPGILKKHLHKQGELIWLFANGIDVSSVETEPPPGKGYGNSTTVPFDVRDSHTAGMILLALAETVGTRLREHRVSAGLVAVEIKDSDFRTISRQTGLGTATDITEEIYQTACRLFEEAWDGSPIRHLGIHTGKIRQSAEFRQQKLFDPTDYEKLKRLNQTVDVIRKRYGSDSIKRASLLAGPVGHMAGGTHGIWI